VRFSADNFQQMVQAAQGPPGDGKKKETFITKPVTMAGPSGPHSGQFIQRRRKVK
jgi:hypothetical protein